MGRQDGQTHRCHLLWIRFTLNARRYRVIRLSTAVVVACVLMVSACSQQEPAATVVEPLNADDASEVVGGQSALPVRVGPVRETTGSVPHVQLNSMTDPAIDEELRRRAFLLPDVENVPSTVSLPGARGLWLADDVTLTRPDVLPGGREFAHIHPDGSLHMWLPLERAAEVQETHWRELHPWVDRDAFWNGVVIVFTPETVEELDVTLELLVDSYNFVTGRNIKPQALT